VDDGIPPEVTDEETRRVLGAYGFDRVPFAKLRRRLEAEGPDPVSNRVAGPVEMPPPGTVEPLPDPDGTEGRRLAALGRRAIDAGEVGVVLLNGGMATRFGGVCKGAVVAAAGRSFLDLKLSQVGAAGRGRAAALLMNSFATERATAEHLARLDPGCEVRTFSQMVSIRLTPTAGIFRDRDGRPSLHAPGHGDLPFALDASGELERFRSAGGRLLTVSNVDNLGACLDPLVVGMHLDRGRPVTVEVVEALSGDVGGFPALVGGRVAVLEAFRLPRGFDASSIPVFNTNSFVFDAAALDGSVDLDWYAVRKSVDGRDAIQFERLVGQLTERLETTWALVPRGGARSRFLPIKTPSDLEALAGEIALVLGEQGALRS